MSYEHKMLSFIKKVFEMSRLVGDTQGPDYDMRISLCNGSWTLLLSNFSTYELDETIQLIHSSISKSKALTIINSPKKEKLRITNSLIQLNYSKDIITMDELQYILTYGKIKELVDGTILCFFEEYDSIILAIDAKITQIREQYGI